MKNRILAFLILFSTQFGFTQSRDQINIVPNWGFEEYSAIPLGWFYSGRDFSLVMKYWSSPTAASPDIYGPQVRIPKQWKKKGFGELKAYDGDSFVGITTYGCDKGKSHCREYIQIQLLERLVPGQKYHISMSVNHLKNAINMKEIQVHLGQDISNIISDTVMLFPAQCKLDLPRGVTDSWIKISTQFVAHKPAEYMTIGNFKPDGETLTFGEESALLPFAYYYLDNIEIYKIPPILDIPMDEGDLSNKEIILGKTIILHNLYFDLDKADFLPRSFKELKTLFTILKDRPNLEIKIIGHTDNSGDLDYNQRLSMSRAQAVVEYLVEKGIDFKRLSYSGLGAKKPIASNETIEGRRQNRRVEFLVVKE